MTTPLTKEKFSSIDKSFWAMEGETTQQAIASFCLLSGLPDKEILLRRLQKSCSLFPRLQMKIVDGLSPYFAKDPHFKAENHLEYIESHVVSSESELLEQASLYFSKPFDFNRSPWKIYIFKAPKNNNYEQTPSALMFKLHHALGDGLGGIEVINSLTSKSANETSDNSLPPAIFSTSKAGHPKTRSNLKDVSSKFKLSLKIIKDLCHRKQFFAFNGKNSKTRKLLITNLPLPELKLCSKALGVTLNDIFLSILGDTVQKYCSVHKLRTSQNIRVIIPVNTRKIESRFHLGNHLTAVAADLPLTVANPWVRLNQINTVIKNIKNDGSIIAYAKFGKMSALFPKTVQRFLCNMLASRSQFLCTNMPTKLEESYIAGAKILGNYGLPALLKNHGVAFSFITCAKKVCASIVFDPHIITDEQLLFNSLNNSIDEFFLSVSEESRPIQLSNLGATT